MPVSNRHRSGGFSLIELMIGMLLGILLMAGAASVYLGSKRSFTEVEQVANLSDNGRFALKLMTDSLRHVGFSGQVFGNTINTDPALDAVSGDCTGQAAAYNLNRLLFAANAGTSGSVFGCITDPVDNTDVLVIKHVRAAPLSDADPSDPNAPQDNVISFPNPLGLANVIDGTRTYIMTNNALGVIFDGADTPPTIAPGGEVPGGTAWEYLFEIYYVRNTGGTPQLARKFLNWDGTQMAVATENIIPGVEDMRLQFGVDNDADGDVDTYTNVAGVTNWARVSSVEAFLLVRSPIEDPNYTEQKTYNLGAGVAVTLPVSPNDPNEPKYRRSVMNTRVSLRNMKLVIRGGA